MKPRILVLRAAGINCDAETAYAFERHGADAEAIHVNRLLASERSLDDFDGLAIPGGFSYGDDIAGGKVLAVEMRHHLADSILKLIDRGGVVVGICNGFQVLVKMGILPGVEASDGGLTRQEATLIDNESNRYEDRWVTVESASDRSIFCPKGQRLRMPVAHGEGRYLPRDPALHAEIVANDLVAFRYVSDDPDDGGAPVYPDDPNGSFDHVAGLVDKTGRVLGLMPHPERAMFAVHDPARGAAAAIPSSVDEDLGDGDCVFKNAVDHLAG